MIEDYMEQEQESGQLFKICLFLKVQKLLATLLYTISSTFYLYVNDPKISLLSAEELK